MSAWILVGLLVVGAVVAHVAARAWHGLAPPVAPDDTIPDDEWRVVVAAWLHLWAAANVRRWQRAIVAFTLVCICIVWVVVDYQVRTCEAANGRARAVSRGVAVGVEEVGDYAGLEESERTDLAAAVEREVARDPGLRVRECSPWLP